MFVKSAQLRLSLGLFAFASSLFPQGALARGERVMGAANEGATLRVQYIEKMERLDRERKQCRSDIESIVNPQLALMDEMGLAGQAGPTKSLHDEAKLNAEAQRLQQLQVELMRLGKLVSQTQGNKDDATMLRNMQAFEQRMRDYMVSQKRFDNRAQTLVSRSENAVSNFIPFAKTLLQIKRAEACQGIWQDLRPLLPLNMEHALLKNRNRLKTQVASLKQSHKSFEVAATRLIERFKPARAVAVEDVSDL
ncbi:MAG: hypothetical protein RI932_2539 [Pseudomonadota bacterium]|jgi:hypothetical protein